MNTINDIKNELLNKDTYNDFWGTNRANEGTDFTNLALGLEIGTINVMDVLEGLSYYEVTSDFEVPKSTNEVLEMEFTNNEVITSVEIEYVNEMIVEFNYDKSLLTTDGTIGNWIESIEYFDVNNGISLDGINEDVENYIEDSYKELSFEEYIDSEFAEIEELEGNNTYNWMASISNHLQWDVYKDNLNDTCYIELRVHKFGDLRANYTESVVLEFSSVDEFYEVLSDSSHTVQELNDDLTISFDIFKQGGCYDVDFECNDYYDVCIDDFENLDSIIENL